MRQIRHSIEVNVPLRAAYNQWTQFEDFPRFMEGVQEVRQKDDVHLHWRAERHGQSVEWDSEIVDQVPDLLIAWRDLDGPGNHGSIHFHPVREDQTRIELTIDLASCDLASTGAQPVDESEHENRTKRRVGADLQRFKQMLEAQGQESGAWRGEIHQSHVERPAVPQAMPGDTVGKDTEV